MTAPKPKLERSAITTRSGERLIRVMIDQKGQGFHGLTFPDTEIQGVAELADKRSAIVLRSGVEIPVAVTYEALEQKIYRPDLRVGEDALLDLRDVTGEAAQPKQAAANSNKPKPGDRMPDGTIYAGISPIPARR